MAVALWPVAAVAHGGGGGGGGHGGGGHGSYQYIYIPGYAAPSIVPAAQVGDYSKIHNVAIVSAIGQSLTLGSTALFASHAEIDISDWKLDDFAKAQLTQFLNGRFAVQDVAYDAPALAKIPNGHLDSSVKEMHDFLAALPAQGVDAFIVVRPDSEGGAPPTPGLSLDASNDMPNPVLEANFEIDVVDAHALKVIAHAMSRAAVRQGVPADFAAIYGPADLKITSKQTPTESQRLKMKAQFERLVSLALLETVRSLSFGVALPETGARNLVPIPPDKDPYGKVKKVAVVSAVGSALMLDHRGAWFAHDVRSIPVTDWNLDADIEKQVGDVLGRRFTVMPVTADRTKLAKLDIPFTTAGLAVPVDGLSPDPDIDLYVVVMRHTGAVPPAPDLVSGFGMWNQTPLGDEYTEIFASYAIAVVDPKTLKIIFIQRGMASPKFPAPIPIRKIDNADWPKAGTEFTPGQAVQVHQAIDDIMSDSVGETLLRMAMTGVMVASPTAETQLDPPKALAPTPAAAH